MSQRYFCLHCHFYQPPRDDPFTGKVPREAGAEPYHDFNEKVLAECYRPNAWLDNFERLSFNIGPTLVEWIAANEPDTLNRIVQSCQHHIEAHGVGNALAQPMHHTILPLARKRDKVAEVAWGIASFERYFGYSPRGMWLPEMAVDYETLQVLAEAGIRFTILSDEQVSGDLSDGPGPYLVRLDNGRSIAIFVREQRLSNQLAFGLGQYREAKAWVSSALANYDQGLVLLATDGEAFGHHHCGAEHFLHDLLGRDLSRQGIRAVTLEHYLNEHPPKAELEIIEYTSWSCEHGVARWATGCDCTPGDSRWKGALRRALDNLASEIDLVYTGEASALGLNAWALRDAYIAIVLGQMDELAFLNAHGLGHLPTAAADRIMQLLRAEFHRQRMYASCAFFFEELSRCEPRYAISNAARAIALVKEATGEDLSRGFRRDLSVAISARVGVTGADLYDATVASAQANGHIK